MAFIQYITQVHLDFGAVQLLTQECERIGMRHPLVVTDAGVRAAGVLDKALAALGATPYQVYDQTPSNPNEAAVRAATQLYRTYKCDGLVAVGGGSSIDLAKGVAIAATHEGPLATYATIEGGSEKITARAALGYTQGNKFGRHFFLSSFDNLRGFRFNDFRLLGDAYYVGQTELAFPLDFLIRFAFFSGITGIVGLDFGGVVESTQAQSSYPGSARVVAVPLLLRCCVCRWQIWKRS